MQDLFLTSLSVDFLRSEIAAAVKQEIHALVPHLQPATEVPVFLTRKEAASLLGISLPTLNEWTKTGRVQGYRIASRVRYKRAELEKSLIQIKTYKPQRNAA